MNDPILTPPGIVRQAEDTDATAINAEHEAGQAAMKKGLEHYLRCGQMLIQKKASLPHGGWLKWLKANARFSQGAAWRYMRFAELLAANNLPPEIAWEQSRPGYTPEPEPRPIDDMTEEELLDRAKQADKAISDRNWIIGECASKWCYRADAALLVLAGNLDPEDETEKQLIDRAKRVVPAVSDSYLAEGNCCWKELEDSNGRKKSLQILATMMLTDEDEKQLIDRLRQAGQRCRRELGELVAPLTQRQRDLVLAHLIEWTCIPGEEESDEVESLRQAMLAHPPAAG